MKARHCPEYQPGPRVCIDCSPLLVRSAGVKTWLYHWINALRASDPAVRSFLEPPPGELLHSAGVNANGARLAALHFFNHMPAGVLDRCISRCDIFHAANLLRVMPRGPLLSATLHDLTAWLMPQFHRRTQVEADRAFATRVLHPAAGIIAVSESTRSDAVRILRINPEKIHVIYPGVPDSYFRVNPEDVSRVAHILGLSKGYFLYIGTVEPRKNIDTLLTAWMSLPLPFRREHELLLAGMPGWECTPTMNRLKELTLENAGVRYLGYLPESQVPPLTAGALALVYPSLYEGFGFPVVQAMAAGCPVIASNVSSLPEITGTAALLVDPRSIGELARAITQMAESTVMRKRLRAEGMERARKFTWQAATARSITFFRNLHASHARR
ncbi:MAG TPA: glycosyltransferase family 1 protein [Bryobacteraceae bacterium]|nr:glycosyltransferase family 1 protein [Bryobacteraceae bacterium]